MMVSVMKAKGIKRKRGEFVEITKGHISSLIDTMPFYIENPCNARVFTLLGDEKSPIYYKNVRVS